MPSMKKGNVFEPINSDDEAIEKDDKNIEHMITKAVEKAVAEVKHEFPNVWILNSTTFSRS